MKLFEYAVIYTPKKEEKKRDEPSVIVPITTVLAENEQEVTLIAARKIPESFSKRLTQCEVAVRPF